MNRLKVIFHIDDESRWNMLLGNVKNLLNEIDSKDIDIEVLGNGNSVKKYVKDNMDDNADLMKILSDKNVKFVACNNSLNGLKLKQDDLHSFVSVVPAGVLELIKRQDQDFSYIKP